MHCAPRRQIPRISCYTKLLIVVKGFSKDLVSVRTAQAIRSKKDCHPFERLWLSVWKRNVTPGTTQAIRFRKIVIRSIRSNDSNYPLEKEMSSLRTTQAIRSRKIVIGSNSSSYPSAALQFQITFTLVVCDESFKKSRKLYSINNSYHYLMNFHGTFSAE